MAYSYLLLTHSYFRWVALVVLAVLYITIWIRKRKAIACSSNAYRWMFAAILLLDIQWLLGLLLYSQSPLVKAFWEDISLGIHDRQIRFFGLEHFTMMQLGLLLLNIYIYKCKQFIGTSLAYTYLLKRMHWVMLILLSSIPWSFSPLTSRPNWR